MPSTMMMRVNAVIIEQDRRQQRQQGHQDECLQRQAVGLATALGGFHGQRRAN
jgi:hypothetical protein